MADKFTVYTRTVGHENGVLTRGDPNPIAFFDTYEEAEAELRKVLAEGNAAGASLIVGIADPESPLRSEMEVSCG